jgi:5-hydroxyisourate hydrolase
MGKLTTHVLDTAHGRPAAGMAVTLARLDGGSPTVLVTTQTNSDGRCPPALLDGVDFASGTYELTFAAGDYFAALGIALPEPRFLNQVVIRFGLADAAAHYHVPLLVSPYSYSTYRGS